MFFLPAALGTYLLVNVLCACVALGIGFAAGIWFFGAKVAKPVVQAANKNNTKKTSQAKQAAERAAMAASRVADLAQNVASDVGDHNAKMKAISADLAGIDRTAAGANDTVFAALDRMLAANAELQQRLEKAEQQLATQAAEIQIHESQARTDSLTGISNRRAFDDELKRRFSEWQRLQTPCSLVLLDIDFFKKFNDTHGHQVGDEVLRQVAKVLKAQSRDMDLPCRYGGEEFGVILPATQGKAACKVAERIRAAIEAAVTTHEGKTLKVTCSIGVAQMLAGSDIAQLIRCADDALYKSKEAGRNCGHWHNGRECLPIAPAADAPSAEASDPTEEVLPDTAEPNQPAPPDVPKSRSKAPGTFIQMLKRRVAESHRFGIPLSLLHLRVEDYDIVKRKYGAAIARQMLDVAEPALEKALREMDVLAPLDKGEFIVMLPGQTKSEANQAAKRLRSATAHCILPLVDRQLELVFQHGIAELKPDEKAQELLARARHDIAACGNDQLATSS